MIAESFYLQCPSNASMKLFPNNTLAEYTVHLETPLEVNGAYEVGLCEIQYPQSWDNVRNGYNRIPITFQFEGNEKQHDLEYEVPPGYYDTV